MSCEQQPPELDPKMYEPLTRGQIRSIREKPLSLREELEMEGATVYDFDGGSKDDKWHDTSVRTKEDIRDISDTNDAGALIMSPCVHTNYIQFRLEAPDGSAKECTCNSCWNRFWIAPFSSPNECPYCHERGFNIAERCVINGD